MKRKPRKADETEERERRSPVDEQTEDIIGDEERNRTPGDKDIDDEDDEDINDEPLGRPVQLDR